MIIAKSARLLFLYAFLGVIVSFISTDILAQKRKKKEKESLEYNIQNLKDAVHRGNSSEIFNMFKSVTNALDLIRAELRKEA